MNVSPQGSRFAADSGGCPAVRAGDALTFEPRQPAGHCVQLIAQRADQLHGLGGSLIIRYGAIVTFAAR